MKKIYYVLCFSLICCALCGCSKKSKVNSAAESDTENIENVVTETEILQLDVKKSEKTEESVSEKNIPSENTASQENPAGRKVSVVEPENYEAEKKETPKKIKKTVINAAVLKGPSGIPMAYMMDQNKKFGKNISVTYETYAAANLVVPKLIKNEIQIAVLPPNLAAKLYNANNGCVKIAAVCGNGMLSILTKDENIFSLSDLMGKELYVAGQGATPDFMIRYLMKQQQIEEGKGDEKIALNFSVATADLSKNLISGKAKYILVPEPFATVAVSKNKSVKKAVNIQEEYFSVAGTSENYPMSVIAVNAEYAKENPVAVKKFLAAFKEAQEWTEVNPIKAGYLVEKRSLGLSPDVVEKAIPFCEYTFVSAKKSRKNIEALLTIFLECDEASVGGTLPDENFYLF